MTGVRFAALVALVPALTLAQPTPKQAEGADAGDFVFSTETRLVQLPVTVMDSAGQVITTLPQSAFQVFENGVPQEIKVFKREDVPVSLGLIIDNSGSMREKRAAVEAAALTLVRDSNKQDEVFVVSFNDDVNLDTDFTNDIAAMERGLKKIDSRGGTAMRDAIRMSVGHLMDQGKRDKKAVLVVTDGNDNASITALDALVRVAQQDEVIVYAIGLLTEENPKEAAKAKQALDKLVSSTGGEVFYPTELSEVERIAHKVAYDIRHQYTIGYTPSNPALDGTYREVKVSVTGPGHPVARTRSGYYAVEDRGKIKNP